LFERVTIRTSDLDASLAFYTRALELLAAATDQFHVVQATSEHPVTRRLHVGFAAHERGQVDAWWRALVDAGYRDDGAPGPRPQYTPDYYGGFVLDPDGNSAEALVHRGRPLGAIDHLWIRVRDVEESRRFYEEVGRAAGFTVHPTKFGAQARGEHGSFHLVPGEPTENVHLAFRADRAAVLRDPAGNGVELVRA
jgi:catechol 2,3-dioxygenase-like lactoylglutathione lyase family enzyme